ncbi:MAG: hypothetical protein J5659_05085 [Clostridia bacterium]|nr:hypothetical protein [Clostridia bacterium]
MKKVIGLLLALVLAFSLTCVAFADGATLTVTPSSTDVAKGGNVTLTLSLAGADVAKSGGLTFAYDSAVFADPAKADGSWVLTGAMLADFDNTKNTAAIAYMSATDINGTIFTLKLNVKSDAPVGPTTISVTPAFKNGSTAIDCAAASATVNIKCDTHSYSDNVVPPTCTEKGYTVHTCTACGYETTDTYVDATGHSWGDWTEVSPADCTKAGSEKRVCSACKVEETRDVAALGHDVEGVEWEYDSGAHWKTCKKCLLAIGSNGEAGSEEHSFGAYTETKAATEDAEGEAERACTVCGYKETKTLPKLEKAEATGVESSDSKTSATIAGAGSKLSGFKKAVVIVDGKEIAVPESAYTITTDPATGDATVVVDAAALAALDIKPGTYEFKLTGEGVESTFNVKVPEAAVAPANNAGTGTTGNASADAAAANDASVTSPQMSDSDIAFLIVALLAIMGSSVFAGVTYRKKRYNK